MTRIRLRSLQLAATLALGLVASQAWADNPRTSATSPSAHG